jgi:AraC family L-rhamnose operon regulatory protein RhaS
MDLRTVSREDPSQSLAIWHNPRETFDPDLGAGNRYRLVFASKGSGILQLGDRREAFLAPAVFCLNEQDRLMLVQNAGLSAEAVYFDPRDLNSALTFDTMRADASTLPVSTVEERFWFRAFLDRPEGAGLHIPLGPTHARRMSDLFEQTAAELNEQPYYWRCRARALLLEIIFLLERLYTEFLGERPAAQTAAPAPAAGAPILPAADDEMEQLLLYLHTHYQEKLTLTALARLFHSNRTTLNMRFQRATGEPLMTYLIDLRMRLAALMLRDSTLPVEEVMARVGYANPSHFGRMFRKHTGCTPSEYRQRFCWLLR